MELYQLTAFQIKDKISHGEIKVREVLDSTIHRISQVEDRIRAFITLTLEEAQEMVQNLDQKDVTGLAGIPCGIKDNMCTKGVRTTCASRMLKDFVPPYDATVVERLKGEGAVMVGKLNLDEFAMGSSTEQSYFYPTRNPWDLNRVPGGSSGGSAAAVAAQEIFYALGSDTGGSIRQPAAFCGIVGLKPTYGLVSRFGVVACASSLDQVGPLTRDVTDCALVLNAIAGHDALDSTSLNIKIPDYTDYLIPDIKGIKIGVPRECFQVGIDEGVKEAFQKALKKYEELGAIVEETTLPHCEYALPAYYLIATAEASSNLAKFDGVNFGYRCPEAQDVVEMYSNTRAFGFGPEVKRRIMLGTYALSAGYYEAFYLKALKARRLIKEDFDQAFSRYDLLLSPTISTTAFKIEEKIEDPLAMYMTDVLTIPSNLAGIPAMSIPAGFVNGLPVGIQLMGKALSEGTLIRAAYAFEQATDFHLRKPGLEVL